MRLIDAEALKKSGKALGVLTTNEFYELIDNAPTVEFPNYGGQVVPDNLQGWRYEERPHGKWIKGNAYFDERAHLMFDRCKCSICGRTQSFYEDNETGELYSSYFCPNCGASMTDEVKI